MKAIEKELRKIEKTEERLHRQAERKTTPVWKSKLEEKIPDKVMTGLQKAFLKAFCITLLRVRVTYDTVRTAGQSLKRNRRFRFLLWALAC